MDLLGEGKEDVIIITIFKIIKQYPLFLFRVLKNF